MLVLLALLAAVPELAERLIARLECMLPTDAEARELEAFVLGCLTESERSSQVGDTVRLSLELLPPGYSLARLCPWAPEVSRFSFHSAPR